MLVGYIFEGETKYRLLLRCEQRFKEIMPLFALYFQAEG
jgi:hypothetical protein